MLCEWQACQELGVVGTLLLSRRFEQGSICGALRTLACKPRNEMRSQCCGEGPDELMLSKLPHLLRNRILSGNKLSSEGRCHRFYESNLKVQGTI